MTALAIFSFEKSQVRTLGTAETPLFVAIDIAKALGFKDQTNAIKLHVDPEDLFKQEIETNGGKQTVNCVNESGLYALIFGSKLESAKRFKRWVTNEVLPAVRRTGRFESTAIARPRITDVQKGIIMGEVNRRACSQCVPRSEIYDELKRYFGVQKFTDIKEDQFELAIKHIQMLVLRQRQETLPSPRTLTDNELLAIAKLHRMHCDPYWKNCAIDAYKVLQVAESKYAGRFYDFIHEPILSLVTIERILKRNSLSTTY